MEIELSETERKVLLQEAHRRHFGPKATARLLDEALLQKIEKLQGARKRALLEAKRNAAPVDDWIYFRAGEYAARFDGDSVWLQDLSGQEMYIEIDCLEWLAALAQDRVE